MPKTYYVYILSGKSAALYVGVTNNLERRMSQQRKKLIRGFTSKYNINRLVYYETFREISDAISREKQIKGWLRNRKIALVQSVNSPWKDLSEGWEL